MTQTTNSSNEEEQNPWVDVELSASKGTGNSADGTTAVMPVADTHLRSVLKGLTWRILASITTMSIAWVITGELKTVLSIGFFDFFAKLLIYYIHERVWIRIRV